MRYAWFTILLSCILLLSGDAIAQRRRLPGPPDRPMRPERVEKLKKMRLVEILKLNEDDAVRFFSKQSAHEDKVRELTKARNDALDELEDIVREKKESADLQKRTDEVLDIDQRIFAERQRFQGEMRKFLTPEQFAKFLAFEREFGQHVRGAMEKIIKERRRMRDED